MRRPVNPLAPSIMIFISGIFFGYLLRKDNAFMGVLGNFSKENV
jgi:hypothetical protein